ncbi:CPBP family intramembrane glutamic endopeptidase [Bacillus canaveralius]|uniref:CPBP family intramembrane glutamic endopeptidase n=1 Tax=Bacillus canaveralius TaxID=1403243 RepID=UPI000F780E05|nr:CPBP family intramembrane metalloprotease [Bacillus canaveralius]
MVGEKWAVLFNGAAFGFSHLAYGFSFISCLGIAIGGLFLAGLTIRSASLLPAAIWHVCLNLLMILKRFNYDIVIFSQNQIVWRRFELEIPVLSDICL